MTLKWQVSCYFSPLEGVRHENNYAVSRERGWRGNRFRMAALGARIGPTGCGAGSGGCGTRSGK
jgi:hypothetical protein